MGKSSIMLIVAALVSAAAAGVYFGNIRDLANARAACVIEAKQAAEEAKDALCLSLGLEAGCSESRSGQSAEEAEILREWNRQVRGCQEGVMLEPR